MTILAYHKKVYPSFGFGLDQTPVCLYTLLVLGGSGHDCAAYEGVGPDLSTEADDTQLTSLFGRIRLGGNKIRKAAAEELFNLKHDGRELSYRS